MAQTETVITEPRGRLDKRRSILDAAMTVFERDGYAGASVDAIAAEAGVAKPTIYNHLGGKENLFRTAILEKAGGANGSLVESIERFSAAPDDLRSALIALARRLVGCMRSGDVWSMIRLLDSEATRFPDLYDSIHVANANRVTDALAGKFARLAGAGLLDLPDPARAASQFIALVSDRLSTLSAMGTRPVDDAVVDEIVEAGVDTFLRAFGAQT